MTGDDRPVRIELWDLPASEQARFFTTLGRVLSRRCPYCGGGDVYRGYLSLKDRCPTCGVRFAREEGYFLGAYALNLVVAEFVGLGLAILLLFKTSLRNLDLLWQEVIAIALVVLFPLLFFPYARGIWMAMDLTFHPPRGTIERQLRGVIAENDDPQRG